MAEIRELRARIAEARENIRADMSKMAETGMQKELRIYLRQRIDNSFLEIDKLLRELDDNR